MHHLNNQQEIAPSDLHNTTHHDKKLYSLIKECRKEHLLQFKDRRAGLLKALNTLDPDIHRYGPQSIELGLLNYWSGRLLAFEPEEHGIARLRTALEIDKGKPYLTEEERTNGSFAIAHCRRIFEGTEQAKAQIMSLLTEVEFCIPISIRAAYELHNWRLYRDALELNIKTLKNPAILEVSFQEERITALRNLAENHYMLGQLDTAAHRIAEAIELANSTSNHALAVEMKFKLGVLAYEAQRYNLALRHMEEGLSIATLSTDQRLINEAHHNLSELRKKINHPNT
jgi:tetratricopeptide (TPR) repeat protein